MDESRRQNPRERRRVLVRFDRNACFTVDVGKGGFSARLLRPLPLHAPLEGFIQVDGKQLPFSGQVAWCRPGDWQLRLPGSMGVRFTRAPQGLLWRPAEASPEKRRLLGT